VMMGPKAENARNYTQCDSMLVDTNCSAHTFPVIESSNASAEIEHEASTSRLNEDILFYLQARGFDKEEAISMVVSGFCKEVMQELPLEFAQEAKKLLMIKLEGSVG